MGSMDGPGDAHDHSETAGELRKGSTSGFHANPVGRYFPANVRAFVAPAMNERAFVAPAMNEEDQGESPLNPFRKPVRRKVQDDHVRIIADMLFRGCYADVEDYLDKHLISETPAQAACLYTALIRLCTSQRSPDGLPFLVFHALRNKVPIRATSFNLFLHSSAKSGDLQVVEAACEDMGKIGLTPTTITFNILINACAQAKNAARAKLYFDQMVERGCVPCSATYGALINAYAKQSDIKNAELWAHYMTSAGFALDGPAYNSLVQAAGHAGDLVKAEHWMNHLMQSSTVPNEKVFNSFVHACSTSRDLKLAEKWFQIMRESHVKMDMITFSSMIHAAAKVCDVQRAEWWMQEMLSSGFEPNTISFNALLDACASVADIPTAERWIERMAEWNLSPNDVSFNTMINVCINGRSLIDAKQWLRIMVLEGWHPNEVTFFTLQRSLSASGKDLTYSKFRLPDWAYITLSQAYEEKGDMARARQWATVSSNLGEKGKGMGKGKGKDYGKRRANTWTEDMFENTDFKGNKGNGKGKWSSHLEKPRPPQVRYGGGSLEGLPTCFSSRSQDDQAGTAFSTRVPTPDLGPEELEEGLGQSFMRRPVRQELEESLGKSFMRSAGFPSPQRASGADESGDSIMKRPPGIWSQQGSPQRGVGQQHQQEQQYQHQQSLQLLKSPLRSVPPPSTRSPTQAPPGRPMPLSPCLSTSSDNLKNKIRGSYRVGSPSQHPSMDPGRAGSSSSMAFPPAIGSARTLSPLVHFDHHEVAVFETLSL